MTTKHPAVFFHTVKLAVDKETRTIRGLAVPFGVVGNNGYGSYRFGKGSLDWSKVKFLLDHDWGQATGTVALTETDAGLEMVAKIAKGARGDQALALAEPDPDTGEAVYDGLSIGLADNFRFEQDDQGVWDAVSATVIEVSGTPRPAFKDAQVTSVAASAAPRKETTMEKCDKCGQVHAEGVTTCATPAPAPAASFAKADGDQLMTKVQTMAEELAELKAIKIPVGPGTQQAKVTEEPIYRFHGTTPAPSGFDFATDLLAAAKDGDKAGLDRVKKFTAEHLRPLRFVDSGDTAQVNPDQYRPDLFLGQAPTPASPLYDFFFKGSLSDVTPFFWTKLDRTNTNAGVDDHVEGTDPADGDVITVAGTTVTPSPVSGKVHITREVGDQGGNPQVSGLVWAEFMRSFSIALETKTAALVNAAAATELGAAIAAGSDGTTAGAAVEAGLVGLQFLADGFRFERAFGHVDLFTALAAATKGADNADKLYPIVNPQNATGQAASRWAYLDIGGYRMQPAASLGATGVNQKSIVADPLAVHVWNSGLQRLDRLMESVEGWDLGCFAYFAGVVYDVTGLRKITYDATV